MIINLLIVLLILIVMCTSITYNTKYKCPEYTVKIRYLRASRLPGNSRPEKLGTGFDTINLKLDRDVPCGMYGVTHTYGKSILFVSNTDSRTGYMHMNMNMKNMKGLDKVNLFDLWDLQRLESESDRFIQTYNRGCCV